MLRWVAQVAFDAWNRGDFELVPHFDDPAVETRLIHGTGALIGLDSVYYGPDGHCRAMQVWNEAWERWDGEIEDILEEGRDRLVVIGRIHAVGSASGVTLNEWGAARYTFRRGRIVRVDGAFDPERERLLALLATSGDAIEANTPEE